MKQNFWEVDLWALAIKLVKDFLAGMVTFGAVLAFFGMVALPIVVPALIMWLFQWYSGWP